MQNKPEERGTTLQGVVLHIHRNGKILLGRKGVYKGWIKVNTWDVQILKINDIKRCKE